MTSPEAPAPARRVAAPIALGTAMLLALGAALALLFDTSRPALNRAYANYIGDRACRDCHPGEYAAHTSSGHSKTLRRAATVARRRGWDGVTADDPEVPGVSWSFHLRDDRLSVERSGPSSAKAAEKFVVDYALGSGRHATTLVSMVDRNPKHPTIREHRLTFFTHADAPGLTPGHSLKGHASGNSPTGRIHSEDNTIKCFGCHATATSDLGSDALDESTMIPDVTCERCHGPARAHVEAAERGETGSALRMPFGLEESATVAAQLTLCGGCHRTPSMVTTGIDVENPIIVRFQPVGLMQSACFQGSDGALACTTCHDPHARTSSDRVAYERTCLSCHADRHVADCPRSSESGCVDCHMPRRDVGRGMMMTDHWIRVVPGK